MTDVKRHKQFWIVEQPDNPVVKNKLVCLDQKPDDIMIYSNWTVHHAIEISAVKDLEYQLSEALNKGESLSFDLMKASREIEKLKNLLNVAVDGLEASECECEISLPVNDYTRDIICARCTAIAEIKEGLKRIIIQKL